ncbi:hypothetical protein EDB83DRAFT_2263511 [Lactarius deliciosus]|nr:hypothetical protein EDB83DRAFT_2263511 [Lactarius deliciosus]
MKSLTVVSFLASLIPLALAQNTTSSLIPSGISTTCQAFYVQLNANAALTTCLKPLISATSAFSAGSNPTTISPSTISSSLDSICSSTNTCDATLINTQLALFLKACQTELISTKTAGVILTYDIMYTFGLLQESLCQKDDSGKYCALNMTSSQSTTKRSSSLGRRDSQVAMDKYSKENIAFLGMQPTNMTSDQLCTPCTRKVMNVYTSQLNTMPYGPGISFSVLLSGQPALYAAINTKCGASFLSGQVQAAGALQTGAAPRAADSAIALVGSAIVAAAAGAIAVL